MPKAAIELLLVGVLILIWHRRYKQLQHRSARSQVRRRPEISTILERMRKEHSERTDTLSETVSGAESTLQHPLPEKSPTPQATGVTGVVATSRRLIRCTEYDVEGELHTEICTVDANGRVLNKPSVVPGPFHCVALDVVNRRIVRRMRGGR